jgi:beta-glucosidase
MPWVEDVEAIVEGWYPGQAHGEATAAVLYGDSDPGGRLPVTFARRVDDYPTAGERRYPGDGHRVYYEEGVDVGYRGFDAADTRPLYPFGHGRSYGAYSYGDVSVDQSGAGATVSVEVENEADRAGHEVVQVYVADREASVDRPPKELEAFAAVDLDAGETRTVECELDERAFAFYDEGQGWTVEAGEFDVRVGRSSRAIKDEQTVAVEDDIALD